MLTDGVLTEAERVRVRHHLGYLNLSQGRVIAFGVPTPLQPQYAVEAAMDHINVNALGLCREILGRLDAIEQQMFENTENQAVTQLGDISINKDEHEQLRSGPLAYWRDKLATLLGVLPNPFSPTNGSGGGINAPVIG
jgi:hypothetical protein